ncbi:hypothetical protein HDG37_000075 [Paraburkholderia sp. MM5384-R2]|nr:hypothetical protein [Paraburkholderia sp. MM5384-R2]
MLALKHTHSGAKVRERFPADWRALQPDLRRNKKARP